MAASGSSSGKTTITAGLARCLAKRGFKVQTFKVGPDFIDPQYLTLASGRQCANLDSWLMDEEDLLDDFERYSQDADVALIEGVRSLYDSAEPLSVKGSTWSVACMTRSPVVLVIDVSGINMGAAAIARGFSTLMDEAMVKGVVLNKARGRAHAVKAKVAVENLAKLKVLGIIPRHQDMDVEMRHLGLVPAFERRARVEEAIEGWSAMVEGSVDVDELVRIASEAPPLALKGPLQREEQKSRGVKIAVALDEAFNFYYRQNMDALRRFGADLVSFSPLTDRSLADASGLILGGGYPQLFLPSLQENSSMMRELKRLIEDECPTYAECGGLMYLCEEVAGFDGVKARGVSVIPAACRMSRLTRFLGYTLHRVARDNVLSTSGDSVRGHEFHYSSIEPRGDVRYAYEVLRGHGVDGKHDGIVVHNALASYTHVLASSQERLFKRFMDNCSRYSKR